MSVQNHEIYKFHDFHLDIGIGLLLRENQPVDLQWKTFETAYTLSTLGNLTRMEGDSKTAKLQYEEALGLFLECENYGMISSLQVDLGVIAFGENDCQKACSLFSEALPMAEKLGYKP